MTPPFSQAGGQECAGQGAGSPRDNGRGGIVRRQPVDPRSLGLLVGKVNDWSTPLGTANPADCVSGFRENSYPSGPAQNEHNNKPRTAPLLPGDKGTGLMT